MTGSTSPGTTTLLPPVVDLGSADAVSKALPGPLQPR
jgi:hypothetical protein